MIDQYEFLLMLLHAFPELTNTYTVYTTLYNDTTKIHRV